MAVGATVIIQNFKVQILKTPLRLWMQMHYNVARVTTEFKPGSRDRH